MKREADSLVEHAERSAQTARDDVLATLDEIRRRIDPRIIAAETAEGLVGRANYLLDKARIGVKNRPLVTFGGIAALLIAVALRIWLSRDDDAADAT